MKRYLSALKNEDSIIPIKVETVDGNTSDLLITEPGGKQCFCRKSEFFV